MNNSISESYYGKLVNFVNDNNLELIGILFEPIVKTFDKIVIHIHGNYGNFYNNKFIWHMSHIYTKNGIAFLSVNLSSHDGLCEGYRRGILDYIGGGVADYSESILDIKAAIEFAYKYNYKEILLQGHSLGCDKVIDYMLKYNESRIGLILLSPVDSYAVQKRWLSIHKNETIQEQISRLKNEKESINKLQWLELDEYGAEGMNSDWIYKIPITRSALINILESSAFKYLNLENGYDFKLDVPTFIFLGKKDGLQMSSQPEMKKFLKTHFTNVKFNDNLDSDHDIIGVEEQLVNEIVNWINDKYF